MREDPFFNPIPTHVIIIFSLRRPASASVLVVMSTRRRFSSLFQTLLSTPKVLGNPLADNFLLPLLNVFRLVFGGPAAPSPSSLIQHSG